MLRPAGLGKKAALLARYVRTIFFAVPALALLVTLGTQATAAPKHLSPDNPAPTEETANECRQQYYALWKEADEKVDPIRNAREHPVASDEACKAATSYDEGLLKVIGFVEANAKRCSFSRKLSEKLIDIYAFAGKLKEQTCPKKRLRLS
jgi:hypothetical protein